MQQQHWFSGLYGHIDAMRLDDFVAGLTPDVEVVVGNNPAMIGREQVKAGIGQLFSAIDGIKHNVINVADTQDRTFLETNVDYLRKDGRQATIPVVTVLERNGDLVKSLRIYFDIAPVFA